MNNPRVSSPSRGVQASKYKSSYMILEGLITLVGIYFIQNQFPTILTELRVRLWNGTSDPENVFCDKWDFIHWGSCVIVIIFFWKDPKIQSVLIKLTLAMIIGFEVIEQLLVCNLLGHVGSCEPWQDTTKDLFTGSLGIMFGYFFPDIISGLNPYEISAWTFSTVIFMPHSLCATPLPTPCLHNYINPPPLPLPLAHNNNPTQNKILAYWGFSKS
eukprot:TRINITY_DN3542_c0_g1_i1.p1 TRINITY_DN3542_c0_g1~~TRINITY_DN3542_c0_g1_i1.p1  ORF type:complete len:230 (-),score=32.02 TRINITY_DN3542_c0_g1_i1:799-1443(-)